MIEQAPRPARHRLAPLTILVLALLAAACAGGTVPGPRLEVEGAWARPSLAPIGHRDDHDHMDHHGPGKEERGGPEHTDGAAHHQSSVTTSAAYFTLRNRGGAADRLVGARTEVAGAVELHLSSIEDGIMRMRQVDRIEVPAKGEARLEPGGYHLMLIGVNRELSAGDRFEVELEFESAGLKVIEVEVGVR